MIDVRLLSLENSLFSKELAINDVADEIEICEELEEIFSALGDLAVSDPCTRHEGEPFDIACYTFDGAWSSGS
jgi:hypothetical protein